MRWFPTTWKSLGRRSAESRLVPKRGRPLAVEDLEGRRLLSGAIHTFVNLHAAAASEMISGPDGNLWVAVIPNRASETVAIDRISPSGSVASFPIPGAAIGLKLTAGPDGNIWFISSPANAASQGTVIGEITPSGQVTEFPLPGSPGQLLDPAGIASGPNGDVWFAWAGQLDPGGPQRQSQCL